MELKSTKMDDAEGAVLGSNCTFMELKCAYSPYELIALKF